MLTSYFIFKQQVTSAHGNNRLSDTEIKLFWELNAINHGHRKTYLTIHYLRERRQFENSRWLPLLSQLKIPIHICWGDKDQVAKIEMAHYLKNEIIPEATLTVMYGLGHFCQLASPEEWCQYVLNWYQE